MKKIITLITILAFVIVNGLAVAKEPPGLKKKGKVPKGFTQGEKKGWDGEYPNGWNKMNKEEREEWLKGKGLDPEEYEKDVELEEDDDEEEEIEHKKGKKKHKKGKKKKSKK